MKCFLLATTVICLSLASATLQATEMEIEARAVWLPEVEELYQSDVKVPAWLTDPSELVVVRGLAGNGGQSATSLAIRETLLPRLMKQARRTWTPWERRIAERETRYWLGKSNVVVKRFEQPFFKMVDGQRYEAFTREAILLDLSEQRMVALQSRVRNVIHSATRHWRGTIGMSVGIVGFLFFACWFACAVLDRLTRGYYIGWLRLAATAVFLVSAGLTLHVTRVILLAL